MEAPAGGWRKEAGWQPTWQELGLGLCREGVSPETSGVFLGDFSTYSGSHKHLWWHQMLCPVSSCSGAFSSVMLVQHCGGPQGKALAMSWLQGLAGPAQPHTATTSAWGHHQAPQPGAPFWCSPWALAWWCQRVVVQPCPSSPPRLRAKQSQERWAVPYINVQAHLSWKFCSVLFCSFGAFFCWPDGQQALWRGWRCCTGGWQHCCALRCFHAYWRGTSLIYPLAGTGCNVYCAMCILPWLTEGLGLLHVVC